MIPSWCIHQERKNYRAILNLPYSSKRKKEKQNTEQQSLKRGLGSALSVTGIAVKGHWVEVSGMGWTPAYCVLQYLTYFETPKRRILTRWHSSLRIILFLKNLGLDFFLYMSSSTQGWNVQLQYPNSLTCRQAVCLYYLCYLQLFLKRFKNANYFSANFVCF